nr:cytochrome f [Cyanidioschyzonaceae sp. 2]
MNKLLLLLYALFSIQDVQAYPIYAQQAYANPREATGRIVCANCHLAQKAIELDVPSSVLPNEEFQATVKIDYDLNQKQILGNGQKGGLNVGAVLILPEGFTLSPKNKSPYFATYSNELPNVIVIGPVPGDKNREIHFPIKAPDPALNKQVHFVKYSIYAGGNRGRGQLYPNGQKSNNAPVLASASGVIQQVRENEIRIKTDQGDIVNQAIPVGHTILVKPAQRITSEQPLTADPNVGGFGQTEKEIVLQNPQRLKLLIAFCVSVFLAQLAFVLKKKQVERVQASEMNF